MKNGEERPTHSDRGASQRTLDFGDEVEPTRPANLLRPECTDPACVDAPSPSVSSETDLMELIVSPINVARAWGQVKRNRGAPGPDGLTITAFEGWCTEHWPAVRQQLLDGTYRPAPVRRKTIPPYSFLGRVAVSDSSAFPTCWTGSFNKPSVRF